MAAWKGSKIMEEYSYILFIALILLSTKILGLVTKKMKLPQVVGALLAGVILGPAVLNVVKETEFISELSEIGVIVLMFTAGLTTDVKELKRTGKASFIIALLGVIVPLFGGLGLAAAMGVGKGDKLCLLTIPAAPLHRRCAYCNISFYHSRNSERAWQAFYKSR